MKVSMLFAGQSRERAPADLLLAERRPGDGRRHDRPSEGPWPRDPGAGAAPGEDGDPSVQREEVRRWDDEMIMSLT